MKEFDKIHNQIAELEKALQEAKQAIDAKEKKYEQELAEIEKTKQEAEEMVIKGAIIHLQV